MTAVYNTICASLEQCLLCAEAWPHLNLWLERFVLPSLDAVDIAHNHQHKC